MGGEHAWRLNKSKAFKIGIVSAMSLSAGKF
jgi:hypothetical protein